MFPFSVSIPTRHRRRWRPASPPVAPPDPPPSEESWSIPVIHNGNLKTNAYNFATFGAGSNILVETKNDSGPDTLGVAVGQGYAGGDCISVTCEDASDGLPGFWVRRVNITSSTGNAKLSGTDKFILPYGQHANRLSYRVKFPTGYRAAYAAGATGNWMTHVGTYNALPSSSNSDENNNWHFYHHVWVRTDLLAGGWAYVELNMAPHHQRAHNAFHAPNAAVGETGMSYWEALTKMYIDDAPYFDPPEISYPFTTLYDDFKLSYVTPSHNVTIACVTVPDYSTNDCPYSNVSDFTFRLTNPDPVPHDMRLRECCAWPWNPDLVDGATVADTLVVTVPAGGTKDVVLRVNPNSGYNPSASAKQLGIAAALTSEVDMAGTSANASDSNIQKRYQKELGRMDGDPIGTYIFGNPV